MNERQAIKYVNYGNAECCAFCKHITKEGNHCNELDKSTTKLNICDEFETPF